LASCLTRLSERTALNEADVQFDIRYLLLSGAFDLGDEQVRLESPAPGRKRIDVEVGRLCIECKRDLRQAQVLSEGEDQLEGYLRAREGDVSGSYVGILTDGVDWRHYQTNQNSLRLVSSFQLYPGRVDERAFRTWLGSLLATERNIQPTGRAIGERLGSNSAGFKAAQALLGNLWVEAKEHTDARLKRALWSKLLRTASGTQFNDDDTLFLEHTYLVLVATLVAHLVLRFPIEEIGRDPRTTLSGRLFSQFDIRNVGEAGFFDWVLDVDGGDAFVSDLLRRLSVFDWTDVDHDVLKELYQSVINEETRHRLGEYYTPDWLAKRIIEHLVENPVDSRVLDPACGSGTFLFHAVRHYLDAAEQAGRPTTEAVRGVLGSVFGVDIHPVAVSLAQVTYLLGIGADRISAAQGQKAIPVYVGDSMRWESASESVFAPSGDIVIPTGEALFQEATALRFPASVVADSTRFDALIDELARKATDRAPGEQSRPIDELLENLDVEENDRKTLSNTYLQLCRLHDEGRDHVWSYYVRNQARPAWLTRKENRVDVLVGNPPWLAYRFMPLEMQARFRQEASSRHLWTGGRVATQQDLSAYFVVRSIEQYLVEGGRFGFVMPHAALSRKAYEGFRAGGYSGTCEVAFEVPWDLEGVEPDPFPVPSCVVFGERIKHTEVFGSARALPMERLVVTGVVDADGGPAAGDQLEWAKVAPTGPHTAYTSANSPYGSRFKQGATLVPRMLLLVEIEPRHPMQPKGIVRVRSRRGRLDKAPWKGLPDRTGIVEQDFLRRVYLGEHCLPFRTLNPATGVIPFDGDSLLTGDNARIDRYKGLAAWWRENERVWNENKSRSTTLSLVEQIDYFGKLNSQFPIAPIRVVYTASGSKLAAAVLEDHGGVIEHKLYWGAVETLEEARYLTAILNAPVLGRIVAHYQGRGAFGPRDFDKYVWYPPIPLYDPHASVHRALASLGARGEEIAAAVDIPKGMGFQGARALIRAALATSGLFSEIDKQVVQILESEDM
jgi:SAM-dependent methyltransferase